MFRQKPIVPIFLLIAASIITSGWGFFAHKKINQHAVHILPEEMHGFYRANINYLTEHAVNADKRRYVIDAEAPRHYLDADMYEQSVPIDTIPHHWDSAVSKYGEDSLMKHGIGPWYLGLMKFKLTEAFKKKDYEKILKLSADIGHYTGDLHVPLHTTKNYNGQLTNQKGIHGFWESRLPELFSTEYDFFVGKAVYIPNVNALIWKRFEQSFAAKDSVLMLEKLLDRNTAENRKYSFEKRGISEVKTYSEKYSSEYHTMLDDMVERRMRKSIHMTASIWMTAWVDAGQPILSPELKFKANKNEIIADSLLNHIPIKGRMEAK